MLHCRALRATARTRTQVTLSYLGRTLTQPLEARGAELQENFGFAPSCPRCVRVCVRECVCVRVCAHGRD